MTAVFPEPADDAPDENAIDMPVADVDDDVDEVDR